MRRAPRLPYCGTCKTLGAVYGHRTRALLNHDMAFLAELLLSLEGRPPEGRAYRSFNCMSLPKPHEIPATLEFVAAASVVLAHFRIADHLRDSGRAPWRVAARLLSPSYRRAAANLRRLEFPLNELASVLEEQPAREAHAESMAHVAEPTAIATALVFSHGARLAGRADRSEAMYRIGHRFGFLIYALDAYEDRAKDARSGDFNPLLKFPAIDGRAEVLSAMRAVETELPAELAVRLRSNVEERLGLRLRILGQRCEAGAARRWRSAVRFARDMREREGAKAAKGAVIFVTAAIVAFLAPHHVRGAESWRHCMGLGMNLMAWGAVFASASGAPPPQQPPTPGNEKKASGAGSCCDSIDCGDDCCCCDGCCCDGCDCG